MFKRHTKYVRAGKIPMPPVVCDVDESTLTETEKLGLIYCKLNNGQSVTMKFGDREVTFSGIGPMKNIESLIGEAETSWAWWRFRLHRSREEWLEWYITRR